MPRTPALIAFAALALAAAGCGSTATAPQMRPAAVKTSEPVQVKLLSPQPGARTHATRITVRGTVSPANATVMVQGHPATVGNGVFVASATVHRGRTRIDVIASASGSTPAATAVSVTRPVKHHAAPAPKPTPISVTVVNPSAPSAPSNPGGGCAAGLWVGPNTTCPFAENVRSAYYAHGGPGVVLAYSPVTHREYAMRCSAGSTIVCSGGDHAVVYFS